MQKSFVNLLEQAKPLGYVGTDEEFRGKASKRESEVNAAIVLAEHLHFGAQVCQWNFGSDLPDLDFSVNGERWWVEVTELHQQYSQGGEVRSWPGVAKPNEEFVGILQDALNYETPCPNAVVYIQGVPRKIERQIWKDEILQAIRTGQKTTLDSNGCRISVSDSLPGTDGDVLFIFGGGRLATGRDGVSPAANITKNIEAEFLRLLRAKSKRANRAQDYEKRVLLIVSQYRFDHSYSVETALELHVGDEIPFDCVLFIHDGRINYVCGTLCPQANGTLEAPEIPHPSFRADGAKRRDSE